MIRSLRFQLFITTKGLPAGGLRTGTPSLLAFSLLDTGAIRATVADEVTAERSLILAATRPSGHSREVVDRALRSEVDWECLIRLALRHRLAPPLLAVLTSADAGLVPEEILDALRFYCSVLREHSEQLRTQLFQLLDALDRRSVVAVPFKGPVLADLLYGDIAFRSPGDLDILVRRESVADVRAELEAQGFVDADGQANLPLTPAQRRIYEHYQCEYQYTRVADEVVVEPHWELTQRPMAIEADYPGMLDRVQSRDVGGRTVPALSPDDLLVALCVHGTKHEWERLSWVRDIAAVLAKFPEIDLERVVGQARARGYSRLMLLSLFIARECAAVSLPAPVVRAIDADGVAPGLGRDVIEGLFRPPPPDPPTERVRAFQIRVRERWTDRLRYVALTLVTPNRYYVQSVSLPSQLWWGYYAVRVGAKFAGPMWRLAKSLKLASSGRNS